MKVLAGAGSLGLGMTNADDHQDQNDGEDPPKGLGKQIQHIVVLTMENRSLGWCGAFNASFWLPTIRVVDIRIRIIPTAADASNMTMESATAGSVAFVLGTQMNRATL
jgi:hypothetical protein